MAGDQAMLGPADHGMLVDIKPRGRFLCRKHPSFSKAIVARAQLVLLDEIADTPGREASVVVPPPRNFPRTISLLVQEFGELWVDVMVEKLVDQRDDRGLRLDLLGRGSWSESTLRHRGHDSRSPRRLEAEAAMIASILGGIAATPLARAALRYGTIACALAVLLFLRSRSGSRRAPEPQRLGGQSRAPSAAGPAVSTRIIPRAFV